jgi:hypothetical protein
VVSVSAVAATRASRSASAATGQEPREEGVELSDPILRYIDGDLLVLRVGSCI